MPHAVTSPLPAQMEKLLQQDQPLHQDQPPQRDQRSHLPADGTHHRTEEAQYAESEQIIGAVVTSLGPNWSLQWKSVEQLVSLMAQSNDSDRSLLATQFFRCSSKVKDLMFNTPPIQVCEEEFTSNANAPTTQCREDLAAPDTNGKSDDYVADDEHDYLEEGEIPPSPHSRAHNLSAELSRPKLDGHEESVSSCLPSAHALPPFQGSQLSHTYQKPAGRHSEKGREHKYQLPDINVSTTRQRAARVVVECLLGPLDGKVGTHSPIQVGKHLRSLPPDIQNEVYAVTKAFHYESASVMTERFHPDISIDRERNRDLLAHSDFVLVPTVWDKPSNTAKIADLDFTVTSFGGQTVKLHPFYVVKVDDTCIYGHMCGTRGGNFRNNVPVGEQHRFMELVAASPHGVPRPFDVLEVAGRAVRASSYIDKAIVCIPLDSPMKLTSGRMLKHSKAVFAIMKERFGGDYPLRNLKDDVLSDRQYDDIAAELRDWEYHRSQYISTSLMSSRDRTTSTGSLQSPTEHTLKRKRDSADIARPRTKPRDRFGPQGAQQWPGKTRITNRLQNLMAAKSHDSKRSDL